MKILKYFLGIVVLSFSASAMPFWMQNQEENPRKQYMKKRNHHTFQHRNQMRERRFAQTDRKHTMGRQGNMQRQRHSNRQSRAGRNGRNMGRHGFHNGMGIGRSGNSSFESTHFATHQVCARCHNNLRDSAGQDVSIIKDWKGTMMANSAVDPLWQAKVHSEILRNPSFKKVIEKECSTCHMPMAKTQAEFDKKEIKIFGDGFLDRKNPYHNLAKDGVSCSLCHQIKPDNLGTEESFSGGYLIDEITKKPYRKIYGPFKNPFERPMIRVSKFQPTYSEHVKKSELCATCHTLDTPTVYEKNVVGKFPEQGPYLEWKNSIYANNGQTCQKCHMPEANGGVKISTMPRFLNKRQPFAKHYFVGGNVFMLSILRDNARSLEIQASRAEFNRVISRTLDMLQNKTADIHIGAVSLENGILEFPVIVENKAGHKFPSGIPIRRAWLHVIVKDAAGRIIFESGAVTKDGKIIGSDSDKDITKYEPHYDIITSQDQVQIYETVMKDFNGDITYTFLNAYEYLKDNRLLPEGFDKDAASSEVSVKGKAATDENFIGGSDTVLYRVNTKGAKGPFTITVELRYQSVSYPFVKDLFKDASKSQYVKRFQNLYYSKPNTGIVIDKEEIRF